MVFTQSSEEFDNMQTTYSVCFKNSISTVDGVALNSSLRAVSPLLYQ